MNDNKKFCKRSFDFNFESSQDSIGEVSGYATVFSQIANIEENVSEIIERSAFDNTDFSDVLLLVNHNISMIPLARSKNGEGTLTLKIDDNGMYISSILDIEGNIQAKNLVSAIKRGDVSGMSFMFDVLEDLWEDLGDNKYLRRIKKIGKVYEVSAVTFPAYEGTSIDSRSILNLKNDESDVSSRKKVVDIEKAKAVIYMSKNWR